MHLENETILTDAGNTVTLDVWCETRPSGFERYGIAGTEDSIYVCPECETGTHDDEHCENCGYTGEDY